MCRQETKYQVLQVSSSPSGPHCVSSLRPGLCHPGSDGRSPAPLKVAAHPLSPTCTLRGQGLSSRALSGHLRWPSSSPLGLGGPEGNGHNLARPDDSGQSAFHLEHYKPPSAGPLTLYQYPHTMVTRPRPRPGCRLVLKKLVAHDSSR